MNCMSIGPMEKSTECSEYWREMSRFEVIMDSAYNSLRDEEMVPRKTHPPEQMVEPFLSWWGDMEEIQIWGKRHVFGHAKSKVTLRNHTDTIGDLWRSSGGEEIYI